jgi:quinol monooxygenase YgiN
MAIRLVVTFKAASGKGAELAQAMKARCEVSRQDARCEQFEVFQSVSDPDKLVLLELWEDQAALDAHAKLQAQRSPLSEGLRLSAGEREDYTYNRTR